MGIITSSYDEDAIEKLGSGYNVDSTWAPFNPLQKKTDGVAQTILPHGVDASSSRVLNAAIGASLEAMKTGDVAKMVLPELDAEEKPDPALEETPADSSPIDEKKLASDVEALSNNVNFVVRMRQLMLQLLEQFSKISDADRKQVEILKREYRLSAHNAADMQSKIGVAGFWIAAISFATSLSRFMTKNPDDRQVVDFLAQQLGGNGAGTLVTSHYQAKLMEYSSVRDLRNTEINMKNSKTQSESGNKQEFLATFKEILMLMKSASDRN